MPETQWTWTAGQQTLTLYMAQYQDNFSLIFSSRGSLARGLSPGGQRERISKEVEALSSRFNEIHSRPCL